MLPAFRAAAKGIKQRLVIDQPEMPDNIKINNSKHSEEQPNDLQSLLLTGFWKYWLGPGFRQPNKRNAWPQKKHRAKAGATKTFKHFLEGLANVAYWVVDHAKKCKQNQPSYGPMADYQGGGRGEGEGGGAGAGKPLTAFCD